MSIEGNMREAPVNKQENITPSIAMLRKEALGAVDPHQEEMAAIDKEIEALQTQKQEGRKFIAKMTNEKMIDIAEKNEDAIDTSIAELELQKQALLGRKPN